MSLPGKTLGQQLTGSSRAGNWAAGPGTSLKREWDLVPRVAPTSISRSGPHAIRLSGKRRRRGEGKKVDLSKPIRFASTGTAMPSEEIDKEEKDDHANGQVGAGFGFGAPGHAGLEVGVPQQEEEELELLPTVFGRRIEEGAERRKMEREKGKKAAKSGGPGSAGPAFETFTKGIGSMLLEKMGYKGGGLGKNQQGIAKPVEAKLQPKNMGMGFNEFRETTTGLHPPPPGMLPPGKEVVVEEPKSKEKLWMNKNKGKKAELRTAAELIAEKEAQNGGIIQQTVLDMRGPQPCLLTNLENLNAEQTAIEGNTPMPELQHNLRLIVDVTEAEVRTCSERLQNERDSVLILNKDRERLETAVSAQGKQIAVMEAVRSSLEHIRRRVAEGGMNLESLAHAFARIKYSYREEYKFFSVGIIALSFSLPLRSNLSYTPDIPQPARGAAHAQPHSEEDRPGEQLTLKEVVEAFAEDNDVLFMPKPGRTYEGLQVYSFGAVSVVVDTAKQSLLAQTGDGWNAVYLGQILEMHRSRGGSRWK